jgi:hypothetical protein
MWLRTFPVPEFTIGIFAAATIWQAMAVWKVSPSSSTPLLTRLVRDGSITFVL